MQIKSQGEDLSITANGGLHPWNAMLGMSWHRSVAEIQMVDVLFGSYFIYPFQIIIITDAKALGCLSIST